MANPEHNPPASPRSPWDIDGAIKVLGAESAPHQHALYGAGRRLTLREAGGPIPPRLDLFPERLVVRYRTNLLRVELLSIGRVDPEADHVLLSSADDAAATRCLIYPDGSLTFPLIDKDEQPRHGGPSALADPGSPTPAAEHHASTAAEKPPRVVLSGRVGRAAQVRTTPKGHTVARVPIAVHTGEETVWHSVLFFDEHATAAQDLAKGQLVTVVGYRHTREATTRSGETRLVEEVYGVSIQGLR